MSTVVVELYEALRKAGVDEGLARSAASAVVPANALGDLATKRDIADLSLITKRDIAELSAATKREIAELSAATKHEIAELSAATKHDIAKLSAFIKHEIAATKSEIAALRLATKADISESRAQLIKWNVGAMAIMTAIFAAIARIA
jgi:hypothetical protein